jgi:hypothetical protein
MDRDSYYIYTTLTESDKPLTTNEISKGIYTRFNIRVSRKICQNYLWSYFRDYVIYNQEEYTYSLKASLPTDFEIEIIESSNEPRALTCEIIGQKIVLKFDKDVTLQILLMAITHLNFSKINSNGKKDLIKEINQRIERLNDN